MLASERVAQLVAKQAALESAAARLYLAAAQVAGRDGWGDVQKRWEDEAAEELEHARQWSGFAADIGAAPAPVEDLVVPADFVAAAKMVAEAERKLYSSMVEMYIAAEQGGDVCVVGALHSLPYHPLIHQVHAIADAEAFVARIANKASADVAAALEGN